MTLIAHDCTLTECIYTRQTIGEMAKSRNLVILWWFDQLMGGVCHDEYFLPGGHPRGRGGDTLIPDLVLKAKIRM